jgi:hypothetical protein
MSRSLTNVTCFVLGMLGGVLLGVFIHVLTLPK